MDDKLRFAILRETGKYKDFWNEHGAAYLEARRHIHAWCVENMEAFTDEDYYLSRQEPANEELSKRYRVECRSEIRTANIVDDILRDAFAIMPALQCEDVARMHPESELLPKIIFSDTRPALAQVIEKGTPLDGYHLVAPHFEPQQPWDRTLRIDLRRKKQDILADLGMMLDAVAWNREQKRYDWEPDRSRQHEESTWQALEVWRLRRKRKTYREIARTLKIKESTAKKAFIRAYELIENRPYDPEMFKRENQAVHLPELRKTCETCPLRDTCTELCPDVLQFVEQDQVKQRELCFENID